MDRDAWASCLPNFIVKKGENVIAAVWCAEDREGEEEANARLIAAAPEMLDALEVVARILKELDADGFSRHDRYEVETAEAYISDALAKARGES